MKVNENKKGNSCLNLDFICIIAFTKIHKEFINLKSAKFEENLS